MGPWQQSYTNQSQTCLTLLLALLIMGKDSDNIEKTRSQQAGTPAFDTTGFMLMPGVWCSDLESLFIIGTEKNSDI
jgi:hypothetical protein